MESIAFGVEVFDFMKRKAIPTKRDLLNVWGIGGSEHAFRSGQATPVPIRLIDERVKIKGLQRAPVAGSKTGQRIGKAGVLIDNG